MLAFYQFEKAYQGKTIIHIPDHELTAGLYHLKGQNGSGKTTLIKSIAGLIPFKGKMELHKVPNTLKHQKEYRQLASFAPSEPNYPGFLKGSDLIRLHQELRNTTPQDDQELIQKLGVTEYQDQPIMGYSSGMIKKLSLVLAFIGSPKLIILDEPLNALDQAAAQLLEPTISKYEKKGSSFILTSHQDFSWKENQYTELIIDDTELKVA